MARIKLEKTYNTRDLGGIPLNLHVKTKSHQFVRSDALLNLSDNDIYYLSHYGISLIIDLRNEEEIQRHPNCLQNHPDFEYLNVHFLNSTKMDGENKYHGQGALSKKNLPDIYRDIVDNHQQEIKRFFKIILANIDKGILFHCSAGKDRTGILSMMLLSIAGIDELDILADYEVSYTYLLPRLYFLQSQFSELPMHIMKSDREILMGLIDHLKTNFGGVIQYLHAIGLSQEELEKIKNKLC